jgi:hypothetical protein
MNVKFTLALLLGTFVIFTSSARATAITRSGSGYGEVANILSNGFTSIPGVTGGVEEWFACNPDTSDNPATGCIGGTFDLVLQITDTTYVGDSLQITLPDLTASEDAGTTSFGLLQCGTSFPDAGLNPILCGASGALLTPAPSSDCVTDFPSAPVGNTITLPGSCVAVGATFYFDEASSDTPDATASAVGVTPGAITTAPEPSSLVLLGIGLIPVALLSRRRVQA